MQRRSHVFLVDDDAELRGLTRDFLARHDIETTEMGTADEMLRRLDRVRPDIVLLDVMMPGTDGIEACRALRARGDDIPIILLTARSDEVDRVLGLEFGADDYMGKPFSLRELVARIRAVLRRRQSTHALATTDAPRQFGRCEFDPAARTISSNGESFVLGTTEYAILRALSERPGQAIPRLRLLEIAHGRSDQSLERSIDVAIHRLRRLIEPNPEQPRYIQTVRGQGYLFLPDAVDPA